MMGRFLYVLRRFEKKVEKAEDYHRGKLSYIFEVNSNLYVEVKKMKKKLVVTVAVLLLLVSIILPVAEARAAMMNAVGSCSMFRTGKCVTFSGCTTSVDDEDTIRVVITLQEKRDGTWHGVSSKTKTDHNTDYVTTTKDYTVSGGHYYRVHATHYVKTGDVVSTSSSNTASTWIPE